MEIATKVYSSKFKKTDYFLKLKIHEMMMSQIRAILNTIDSISAVYTVDANQIKSKTIFNTNDFKQNQNCSDIRACM
jgi:hypothetical protein